MTDALRRGLAALMGIADGFFRLGWPSYALVIALQIKVMWLIWDFKDLVFGDTSYYFVSALSWHDQFKVNFAWSPLYTAFYGSFLFLTSDPYIAQVLHRIVIILILAVGTLFLLRLILPAPIALLGACWWAILPINFDALYEVHLYGSIFVIAAWAAIASGDSPWNRGLGVAILGVSAVLVRSELGLATCLLLIVCLIYEWRRYRGLSPALRPRVRQYFATYCLPLLGGAIACAFMLSRSLLPIHALSASFANKHTISMCQGFAASYQQRHPAWNFNAMTECQGLMTQIFGIPRPSLGQMIAANPHAVLEHFLWNLELLPNGLQVLLFNAMSGQTTPDFIPHETAIYPLVLGWLVIGILLVGGWITARHWDGELTSWLQARAMIFASFLPLLVVDLLITVVMRPRPSYILSFTISVIAVVGTALWFCIRRVPAVTLAIRIMAPCLAIALVIVLPSHFHATGQGRPIHDDVERLLPQRNLLMRLPGILLLGKYPVEVANYLGLASVPGLRDRIQTSALLDAWDRTSPLTTFLSTRDISAAYLDAAALSRLLNLPEATSFLDRADALGWRIVAEQDTGLDKWMLLINTDYNAESVRP
jgi:hypothetical protein